MGFVWWELNFRVIEGREREGGEEEMLSFIFVFLAAEE